MFRPDFEAEERFNKEKQSVFKVKVMGKSTRFFIASPEEGNKLCR